MKKTIVITSFLLALLVSIIGHIGCSFDEEEKEGEEINANLTLEVLQNSRICYVMTEQEDGYDKITMRGRVTDISGRVLTLEYLAEDLRVYINRGTTVFDVAVILEGKARYRKCPGVFGGIQVGDGIILTAEKEPDEFLRVVNVDNFRNLELPY